MKKKPKVTDADLETGTLFLIPLSRGRRAIGQIVIPGVEYYACAFLPVLEKGESLPEELRVTKLRPALCFLAYDTPFYQRRWRLIGQAPVHPKVPFPHFKLDKARGAHIMDVYEKFVRVASEKDERTIPYRTSVDYLIVSRALESLLATGKVEGDDREMLPSFIRRHAVGGRKLDRKAGKKHPRKRSRSKPKVKPVEQAVIVEFACPRPTEPQSLFALEAKLEAAIASAGVGEYDGNEIAADISDGTFYMYGPDADALFAVVRPILKACKAISRVRARLRYGPAEDGVREREVKV